MDHLTLHRAVAYRRDDMHQPECVVFFEARAGESAAAKLLRLLSLTWDCEASQVEIINLHSEAELVAASRLPHLAGDARWLECGHTSGRTMFYTPDAALLLVRPLTAQRLQRAFERARVWHTVADARMELLAQTLPQVPRLRQAMDRAQRRAEDRALAQFMAMAGASAQGPAAWPGGRR